MYQCIMTMCLDTHIDFHHISPKKRDSFGRFFLKIWRDDKQPLVLTYHVIESRPILFVLRHSSNRKHEIS